ncbi:MAG TPA: tetratricopeptide repeat protein, partial [Thermoanaerobaculia bacterium]|nr:tetratricopeptide repeat protein [Thermoanaerobaculia bacterium]
IRSSQLRTFTQIGGSLNALGQRDEALQYLRRAVAIGETLHATDRGNAEIRHRLAETYLDLGTTLAAAGARKDAVEILEKARELLERWWRANPWNAQIAVTLAGVYEGLGLALEPFARPDATAPADASWSAARPWYQRSLDVWHDLEARNRLARLYRSRTERVAEAVLRCDAALAKTR